MPLPTSKSVRGLTEIEIKRAILRLLLLKNDDQRMEIAALTDTLNSYLTPAAGGPNMATGEYGHSPQGVRNTLNEFRDEGEFLSHTLHVPYCKGKYVPKWAQAKGELKTRGLVHLEAQHSSALEVESTKEKKTKRLIGDALWFSLLGIHLAPDRKAKNWDGRNLIAKQHITPETRRRLLSIRARSALSLFLDSGSTTIAAARVLANSPAWPLRVTLPPHEREPAREHLVLPHLTTNCPAIADMFSNSKHRFDSTVRLLGGDMRADRGSICGPLAEMCMEAWKQVHTDVAVIGTTAIRKWTEVFSFCSSDTSEARIKTAIMENAHFKVIIMDSSKLKPKSQMTTNVFATLQRHQVDLVVTNLPRTKGKNKADPETCELFKNFVHAAQETGVSYVITPSDLIMPADNKAAESDDEFDENAAEPITPEERTQ